MSAYSNTASKVITSGVPTCVVLPMPSRGTLDRLVIQQTDGTEEGFTFAVYDRRGACVNEIDLNTVGGEIVSVAASSGQLLVTTATAHTLAVGETVEIKSTSEDTYHGAWEVLSVPSEDSFVIGVTYAAVADVGGYWQRQPAVNPMLDPTMHVVYPSTDVNTKSYQDFDIDQAYENRDSQSVTARRRAYALYMEITPEGSGDKTFMVGFTATQARLV